MKRVEAIDWKDEKLVCIDQRKLPVVEEYFNVVDLETCHEAIKVMVVRGAPLIGFTAIFGIALWVKENENTDVSKFREACDYLISARPTAVNLEYEVNRLFEMGKTLLEDSGTLKGFYDQVVNFGHEQIEKIRKDNQTMADIALEDLDKKIGKDKYRLMTLCNTGFLACGPMGTALGVISSAHKKGRVEHVYASETRPYLQGGRLTAYELKCEGIPFDVIVEGAFSYLLKNKLVDAVFIGADRIAGNGDTANKIGSSTLSIVCKHYGVPFYTVAPTSSFDLSINSGDDIPIEMRNQDEVLFCQGQRIAPEGASALNPSFDVTSNDCLEGVICEKGLISPVNEENLRKVVQG